MLVLTTACSQWCIAKNGAGYTQTGVAKGLKVPCFFMITEVSIRCQKKPEVGIRRIPAYTPQYTTACSVYPLSWVALFHETERNRAIIIVKPGQTKRKRTAKTTTVKRGKRTNFD